MILWGLYLIVFVFIAFIIFVLLIITSTNEVFERSFKLSRRLSAKEVATSLEVEVRKAFDEDVVREVRVLRDFRVEPGKEREGHSLHLLDVMLSRLLPLDLKGYDSLLVLITGAAAAPAAAPALLLLPLLLLLLLLVLLALVDNFVLFDKLGVLEDRVLFELENNLVPILGYDIKPGDVVKQEVILLAQKARNPVIGDLLLLLLLL